MDMAQESMQRIQELEKQRDQLKERLGQIGDMRQGSLVERYIPCGKSACHCHAKEPAGHGPYFSLTRAVEGKTKTRIIPIDAVPLTQAHLEECQKFRELSRQLLEVSDQLCEIRLSTGARRTDSVAKKKTSRRR